jgi:capsular exopolysaccharide synthesis family protein
MPRSKASRSNGANYPDVVPVRPGRVARAGRALPPPPVIDVEVTDAPPHHLRDYLRILLRHRRLALGCFGATLGLAVLFTLLSPRAYTASTRLQIARQSPIQLRLENSVRRLDDGDNDASVAANFVSTQVAALKSRDLAERVIRRFDLAHNPTFLHPDTGPHALPAPRGILRPRGWDDAPDAVATASNDPVDPKMVDRYQKLLGVTDVRGTDLIEVSFTTPSPSLSAFLVAAHTQAYLEANQDARRATDDIAGGFLSRQLGEARKGMRRAEATLRRFARTHAKVAANQEHKLDAARMAELSTLLTKAEGTRATYETRYEFLTKAHSDPTAYFLDRPGVQKLRLALLDVQAQRAGLDARLGPNHPQIQELASLESELEKQLQSEVKRGIASARAHFDAAKLREDRLRKKLTRQETTGAELRNLGSQYDLLKNDVDSARALHASLLKQRAETEVNSELAAPNVRVIERPEVPGKPSKPKVLLDLVLGTFTGIVLGIGAAFGRDYFDGSVRSSEEAEDALQLPLLAAIPNFTLARGVLDGPPSLPLVPRTPLAGDGAPTDGDRPSFGGNDLLVLHEPWSRVAEAFRSMRTAVLFSVPDSPPQVILVTSARAAEGKTVASLNLATTLAEAGSRVLLLDADLRHPRCHMALGIDNEGGLSGVLAGDVPLEAAVRALDALNLFVLPAGRPPANPAELVGSQRMREVLAELRTQFDFIVVDTPPVLPVTDAVVLAREVDGVVLVVKGHDTPRELARRARDRLVLAGANFLGVMVNNVGLGWGDPYFYDSYYGYARPADGEQRA